MNNSQEVAKMIKAIAKLKHVTIGKMLSDCQLSVNTLSSMQAGGYYPRLEAITKIADYLDCSVDYLLGRSATPEMNQPIKEKAAETNVDENSNSLKPNYNKLNAIGKQKADEYIADLAENPKYIQDNQIMQDMLMNDLASAFSKNKVQN